MKTTEPDHLAWLAQGVRQHILLRVLPVQRHDALGPLSVARMALTMAQRRLASDPPALQALAEKLAEIEIQVREAVTALGRLRWWDSRQQAPRPWTEVVRESSHLLEMPIALRGHTLQLGPLWTQGEVPMVATPSGHLAVMGLLLHAVDHHAGTPCAMQLAAEGKQLRLDCRVQPNPTVTSDPSMDENAGAGLSLTAYKWLLADIGWNVESDGCGWSLTLSAGPSQRISADGAAPKAVR